jgi:hypothetical protein
MSFLTTHGGTGGSLNGTTNIGQELQKATGTDGIRHVSTVKRKTLGLFEAQTMAHARNQDGRSLEAHGAARQTELANLFVARVGNQSNAQMIIDFIDGQATFVDKTNKFSLFVQQKLYIIQIDCLVATDAGRTHNWGHNGKILFGSSED